MRGPASPWWVPPAVWWKMISSPPAPRVLHKRELEALGLDVDDARVPLGFHAFDGRDDVRPLAPRAVNVQEHQMPVRQRAECADNGKVGAGLRAGREINDEEFPHVRKRHESAIKQESIPAARVALAQPIGLEQPALHRGRPLLVEGIPPDAHGRLDLRELLQSEPLWPKRIARRAAQHVGLLRDGRHRQHDPRLSAIGGFSKQSPSKIVGMPSSLDDDHGCLRLQPRVGHRAIPVPEMIPVRLAHGLLGVLDGIVDQ